MAAMPAVRCGGAVALAVSSRLQEARLCKAAVSPGAALCLAPSARGRPAQRNVFLVNRGSLWLCPPAPRCRRCHPNIVQTYETRCAQLTEDFVGSILSATTPPGQVLARRLHAACTPPFSWRQGAEPVCSARGGAERLLAPGWGAACEGVGRASAAFLMRALRAPVVAAEPLGAARERQRQHHLVRLPGEPRRLRRSQERGSLTRRVTSYAVRGPPRPSTDQRRRRIGATARTPPRRRPSGLEHSRDVFPVWSLGRRLRRSLCQGTGLGCPHLCQTCSCGARACPRPQPSGRTSSSPRAPRRETS